MHNFTLSLFHEPIHKTFLIICFIFWDCNMNTSFPHSLSSLQILSNTFPFSAWKSWPPFFPLLFIIYICICIHIFAFVYIHIHTYSFTFVLIMFKICYFNVFVYCTLTLVTEACTRSLDNFPSVYLKFYVTWSAFPTPPSPMSFISAVLLFPWDGLFQTANIIEIM